MKRIATVFFCLILFVTTSQVFAKDSPMYDELMNSVISMSVVGRAPNERLQRVMDEANIVVRVRAVYSWNNPAYAEGTVVYVDEAAFSSDMLLQFVLLHEQGHIMRQHNMRTARKMTDELEKKGITQLSQLKDSPLLKLPAFGLFDVNALYREFEYEADAYAIESLHQQGKLQEALPLIAEHLLKNSFDVKWEAESTHPTGEHRVQAIKAYAETLLSATR